MKILKKSEIIIFLCSQVELKEMSFQTHTLSLTHTHTHTHTHSHSLSLTHTHKVLFLQIFQKTLYGFLCSPSPLHFASPALDSPL